jgi:multiple sugar transport system permease protein
MKRHTGTHIVLLLGAVVMASAFAWMLSTSLMTDEEANAVPISLLPAQPRWGNFLEAWGKAPFGRYFVNSALTALAVTVGVLFTSILAGYAFACLEFRGKGLIFGALLATMMIPFEVTVVPNSLLVQWLGWYDTYLALIVPWTANVFSIFLMRQFFRSLPRDYFEAAQVDGCGHWRYLWRVAVPMVSPAVVTVALFAFLGSWNSLLWPLIVTDSERMRTLQFGLTIFLQEEHTETHLLMAAASFTIAPVVVLYLVLQRRFIEGVTGVGLKQ